MFQLLIIIADTSYRRRTLMIWILITRQLRLTLHTDLPKVSIFPLDKLYLKKTTQTSQWPLKRKSGQVSHIIDFIKNMEYKF